MKQFIMALATAAVLAGCGNGNKEKATPTGTTNAVATTYAEMGTDAVLVTVNGKPLTKLDVETDLTLQLSLLRMAKPNIKGDRIREEQDRMIRKSVDGFIRRRVMMDEAEKRGVVATAEEIEAVHTNFMATAFRGKKLTYSQMRSKLRPAMAKKIDADLSADAAIFKLRKLMAEETAYEPTDAEVAEKLVKFAEYNTRAKAIESQSWQTATNVWRRIEGGEPFEKAAERAKKIGDHVTFEPEWGSFEISYFNDTPALQACLKVMKPGMVTPPIPADNGIVIAKLESITEPEQPNAGLRYNLGQIHFALPEYYKAYTAETLKAELATEMSNRQLKAKIDALTRSARVEYPSGDVKRIFRKTQKEDSK